MSSRSSLVITLPWLFCHKIRNVKRSLPTIARETLTLTIFPLLVSAFIRLALTECLIWFALEKCRCAKFYFQKGQYLYSHQKYVIVVDLHPDWFLMKNFFSGNLFFFRCSFLFCWQLFLSRRLIPKKPEKVRLTAKTYDIRISGD